MSLRPLEKILGQLKVQKKNFKTHHLGGSISTNSTLKFVLEAKKQRVTETNCSFFSTGYWVLNWCAFKRGDLGASKEPYSTSVQPLEKF